ncbi:MAG: periplasmic glucan biosynthesis protein MdoG [Lacunisphaera sp.]|nr:periplasmic glucan biosynthesis protein MdoG [Lacunisphaera sp.]
MRPLAHFTMALRFLLRAAAAGFLAASGAISFAAVERVAVDHAYVAAQAKKLAAGPFRADDRVAPKFFRDLNYDRYHRITFDPKMTLWGDAGRFRLQFFHPGYLFSQMVHLNEFTDTHAQPIPFAHNFFDYHDLELPLLSHWGLDFAGFRVLHPLNEPGKWDEVISFLGTSYYRALGRRHIYGASGRGLALNAGGPVPEEFSAFREFWIRKPEPNDPSLTVHALLDSPGVAGAYTFIITPGEDTVIETHATLFFRNRIDTPGFAPVSTMFWFGEGSANRFGDFRPEVHDSDGLLVATDANTRVWRPLLNAPAVWRTDFDAPAFAGFGLLQRDRDFRNYQDFEARFERRPGVWMEPIGTWPAGFVRLVEIPTKGEYNDNITAFWSPRDKIPVGQPYEIAWKQHWSSAPTFGGPPGWVSATRQTAQDGAPDQTKYVVDFDRASLAQVAADAKVTADVSVTGGAELQQVQMVRNEADGARRLVIKLRAKPGAPVDVRARLMLDGKPLTETWTTRWQP